MARPNVPGRNQPKQNAAPVVAPAASAAPVVAAVEEATLPVVETVIEQGNKTMADINETVKTAEAAAQTFATDAAERGQAMMSDYSARAKAAAEKSAKTLEGLVAFQKDNLEAMAEAARVAAKGTQELARHAVEFGRKSIEDTNATMRKFAEVKSPTEFFQLQSEASKAHMDALVAETSKMTENYFKLIGEIAQPVQNRYAVAMEKARTLAA